MTCGLSSLLLVLNVAHDAVHDALFRRKSFNRLVSVLTFNLLGVNAYLWRMRHVNSHHVFPNVNGCDIDIDHNLFIRLSPNQPSRWYHRYQHIYAPALYMLVAVHTIFIQDPIYLFKTRLANMRNISHPTREIIIFVAAKLAYSALMISIPIWVMDLSPVHVAVGYATMSAVVSLLFVFLLIGTHFAEETEFPTLDADGSIPGNWVSHTMDTSLDWAPESKIANFLVGGINTHAAHHLFPTVSHVHYVALTRIIHEAARKHGVRYNRTTLPGMLKSHFAYLRHVGNDALKPPVKKETSDAISGSPPPRSADQTLQALHG